MVEKVGTVPLTYQFATSIAIDPQGAPHITFYTQDTNDLALASGTGAGWTINIVDDDGDTGRFASLVIDEEGRFHISYTQRAWCFGGRKVRHPRAGGYRVGYKRCGHSG